LKVAVFAKFVEIEEREIEIADISAKILKECKIDVRSFESEVKRAREEDKMRSRTAMSRTATTYEDEFECEDGSGEFNLEEKIADLEEIVREQKSLAILEAKTLDKARKRIRELEQQLTEQKEILDGRIKELEGSLEAEQKRRGALETELRECQQERVRWQSRGSHEEDGRDLNLLQNGKRAPL
jgi:chromosome segregation ATPase